MAKQSGIHQLCGKVGEHSYYRQTGIQSGLVRSINQGMSQRVKTDEAFLNTRLNNAEFGQAGRLASVLCKYIVPKFRPMILPFSQSKMAKIILAFIKNDTDSAWGQRNITQSNSGDMQVTALNSVSKNSFDDFGLLINIDEETAELEISLTEETNSKLTSIGCDGLICRFVVASTFIGKYIQGNRAYSNSFPYSNVYTTTFDKPEVDTTKNITYVVPTVPTLPLVGFAAQRTGILIVMPYRNVNGGQHILQEHCTFKAFILQDGFIS